MYFRKKRSKLVSKKRVALRGGRSTVVSKNVKRYVARALSRRIEDKQVGVQGSIAFGSAIESPDLNAYPMLPYLGYLTIPQGVGQGQRNGNECKVKRVMLNYVLYPLPYNAGTNPASCPMHIQLFLGNVKLSKGILPITADVNNLFNLGGGVLAPTGSLTDLNLPINKDVWDIKKVWSHKLGYAESAGTGAVPTQQYFANNDFKLNITRRMDITRYCAAALKFNDNNATLIGNNTFFMFQALAANGAAFGATVVPAQIQFFVTIDYEDA